ncbi:MAG: DUF6320 domain-containing protein [Gemmiger sp.]|nr:DUF6320 domain-containing protein [Gemmiger sp.]
MKTCPNCKIQVGGADYCPFCQSALVGSPTTPIYPHVEPEQRRLSFVYKVVAFGLLAVAIVCMAVDFMGEGGQTHWSVMVLLCVAAFLVMLRLLMKPRPNIPRIMFQLLGGVSLVVVLCDAFVGFPGFSIEYVIPVFCSVTLILNFILAFVNKCFTENGLVYLLMNILVGIIPYIIYIFNDLTMPLAWAVCLVISVITFVGLVVFKGKLLFVEIQKRLHM